MTSFPRAASLLALLALGCGSGPSTSDAAMRPDVGPAACASPGMPTTGAADTHCAPSTVQPTSQASCFPGAVDAGPPLDAGPLPDAGIVACDYGPTLFGMEGDDDDCKYHVRWTATPICEGSAGVFFTVVATNKTDGSPVTGGHMRAETFVSAGAACDVTTSHPGPNTFVHLVEGPMGTYTGPIQFDQPGQWTVRFHVFEECSDAPEDSPHGHVAFRLSVP